MNLDLKNVRLIREGETLCALIDGERHRVDRVAKAFPQTDPERFVGLIGEHGHEIGLIEKPADLDEASWEILSEALRIVYFVPTITEIRSVEATGTATVWEVETDDGEQTFRIQDREALDGTDAPSIVITDQTQRRYRIDDYWELDRDSRALIRDLLPTRILRLRHARRRS